MTPAAASSTKCASVLPEAKKSSRRSQLVGLSLASFSLEVLAPVRQARLQHHAIVIDERFAFRSRRSAKGVFQDVFLSHASGMGGRLDIVRSARVGRDQRCDEQQGRHLQSEQRG